VRSHLWDPPARRLPPHPSAPLPADRCWIRSVFVGSSESRRRRPKTRRKSTTGLLPRSLWLTSSNRRIQDRTARTGSSLASGRQSQSRSRRPICAARLSTEAVAWSKRFMVRRRMAASASSAALPLAGALSPIVASCCLLPDIPDDQSTVLRGPCPVSVLNQAKSWPREMSRYPPVRSVPSGGAARFGSRSGRVNGTFDDRQGHLTIWWKCCIKM
jgi:hypothetical protein